MSWSKIKLGDVIKHRKGFITIDDTKEYKLCRVQVNRRGVLLRDNIKGKDIKTKKQQVCKTGDFLVAEMDAKVGGYGFVTEELDGAIVSSHYFLFELDENKIRPKFLEVISQLLILQDQIKAIGSTNYAAIRPVNVLNWEIPFTNIEHQLQIENLYDELSTKGKQLSIELSSQLSIVKKLRQQLLQDAVHGNLVEQDPNDEPASELLKKIKAEKEQLIGEKKLKKEKDLQLIKVEEIPFEIPGNWIWCKLGEITNLITDGEHLTPPRISTGRKLLSAKNIRDGFIEFENVDFISEETFQKSIKRCYPQKGDILIVSVGGTIGRSSILEGDKEFAIVRSVALIKPVRSICNRYIKLVLDSPLLQNDINIRAWGTAQPCLYINQIKELTVPLPPLSDQLRIVLKLEKLFQICNALEESIKQSTFQNEKLLQQVLREALQSQILK